jgi:hypothetical protein
VTVEPLLKQGKITSNADNADSRTVFDPSTAVLMVDQLASAESAV